MLRLEKLVRLTETCAGFCSPYAGYGMPIDEEELDRIDLKHRLYTILLGEKLFVAPIGDNPQRVLDLGTGSGTFCSFYSSQRF